MVIAHACGDVEFLEYAKDEILRELRLDAQGDEPEDIALKALVSAYHKNPGRSLDYTNNITVKDVRDACKNNLGIDKSSQWLKAVLQGMGFEVSFYQGYDHVKANPQLVSELLKERDMEG
jgi:hypothetical protein